jgi:transcriptional regulator with XRE-family HTH domain
MAKSIIPQYDQHPIAVKIMPGGMNPDEFEALCTDVELRGVIFPITLFEGKVLDGWHRYRAAHKTGTMFKEIEYKGSDPSGYIAACNVLRRRLSSLQRAYVGAQIHLDHNITQREACKRFGISNEALSLVLKAIESKSTRLLKKIEDDSEFTRGMLKEELEDMDLGPKKNVTLKKGSMFPEVVEEDEPDDFTAILERQRADKKKGMKEHTVGDYDGVPATGKKNSHTERRAKSTEAQRMAEHFKTMMYDEKSTFIQMVWPELRPIAEELKLAGLVKVPAKAKLKKVA